MKMDRPKQRGMTAKKLRYVGFTVTKFRRTGFQSLVVRDGLLHLCPTLQGYTEGKT